MASPLVIDRRAEVHKALGNPLRLALLEELAAGPCCVCDLARRLGLNKSAASKHLSLLHDVGLLAVERRGTQVIYRWSDPAVATLLAWR